MSRSLNRVDLIGNVGSDPEVRTTDGGRKVARLSLATNFTWKGANDEQQEKTEWHTLTAWGPLADVIEKHVNVGDKLYVSGRIQYSKSEHEGTTRFWTEIIVRELLFLGSKSGDRHIGERAKPPLPADDDDLPF